MADDSISISRRVSDRHPYVLYEYIIVNLVVNQSNDEPVIQNSIRVTSTIRSSVAAADLDIVELV